MDLGTNRWAVVVGGVCALVAAGCGGDDGEPSGGGTTTTATSTTTGDTTTDSKTTSSTTTGDGGTGGTPTGGGGTGGEPAGGGGTGGTGAAGGSGGTGGDGGGPVVNCGDGIKDPGEQCDGADLGGKSCVDLGYSHPAGLICGMDCTLKTGGCQPTCNGAKLEPGEVCDGAFLGNVSCQDFGFQNPAGLTCVNCQPNPSGCSATCGNGVLEQGELCDGANLGGKSCQDYGFSNPAGLACGANCVSYSTAGCSPTCNGVLEPGETCDGAFLNGKTCLDFGYGNAAGLICTNCSYNTNGCATTCGNGVTEPGEQCDDGNTVGGDGCGPTCQLTSSGATCAAAITFSMGLGTKTFNFTTVGGGQHTSGSCTSAGPDRVFAVTANVKGFLTASLTRSQTAFNSVLYAGTQCVDGVNTAFCADSKDPNNAVVLTGGEVVSFPVVAGQKHFFFVDGPAGADAGAFRLVLDLSSGDDCTDPVPIPLEPGTPMTLLGNTTSTFSDYDGSCGGLASNDAVYQITRSNAGPLTVIADAALTNYNSVVYARSNCASFFSELACENVPGTSGEILTVPNVQANTPVFLVVDGKNFEGAPNQGNYGLVVTP